MVENINIFVMLIVLGIGAIPAIYMRYKGIPFLTQRAPDGYYGKNEIRFQKIEGGT